MHREAAWSGSDCFAVFDLLVFPTWAGSPKLRHREILLVPGGRHVKLGGKNKI